MPVICITIQCHFWFHPVGVDGFFAVTAQDVVTRRTGQEKTRIPSLGGRRRGHPVGKVSHVAKIEMRPASFDERKEVIAFRTGQTTELPIDRAQNASFLPAFANTGDAECHVRIIEVIPAPTQASPPFIPILLLDHAAGEDPARRKRAYCAALYQQYLERIIPHEQNSRGKPRLDRRSKRVWRARLHPSRA